MKTNGQANAVTLEWLLSKGDVAGDPPQYSTVRAAAIHAKLAGGEAPAGGRIDLDALLAARMETDFGQNRSLLSELLSVWQGMRSFQQCAVLAALLEHGLPVDAAPQGVPILHIVAAGDVSESVQLLINAGANLDLVCQSDAAIDIVSARNVNVHGLTAIELARTRGCKNSLQVLEAARARRAMLDVAAAAMARRQ